MNKIYFFSYFRDLVLKDRNAPLASESISLYLKELLDSNFDNIEYINLAPSKKSICCERNISDNNYHQIGTKCFGKIYRKLLWKKTYWKRVYRFCKKHIDKDDVMIIYHSLYTNHLIKKVKRYIKCKVILVGAEIYSDVTHKKHQKHLELETYAYANAHILISETLRDQVPIKRPSLILSGDYRHIDLDEKKFYEYDNKIHLVYSGTFDKTKGGAYLAVDAMKHLGDEYVLHILGFGDTKSIKEYIDKNNEKGNIIFEGVKSGNEFLCFLNKCDIGLSTQNCDRQFNNSSFPSKIITYAKCGLLIISTPSISVSNSPFKEIVSLSNSDKSEDIAKAIREVKENKKNVYDVLDTIRNSFEKNFVGLVNNAFSFRRILVINNCFGGSTGNIARQVAARVLARGNDCLFSHHIGHSKEFFAQKYGCIFEHYLSPLLTRFTGRSLRYMRLSTRALIRITKSFKPDLVNVHCMNSYSMNNPIFFKFLKNNNFKTVITNHALFYATGTCGYPYGECKKYLTGCGKCPNKRYSCKSFFRDRTKKNWQEMYHAFENSGFYMTSVSNYVRDVCLESPITKDLNNLTIFNGIDTSNFGYKNETFGDGKIHILYVISAVKNQNKGFAEFVKIVESLQGDENFVFHVVGDEWLDISSYSNVTYHGFIKGKKELAKLYSLCDLFLLTSRRETFSLPIVESLCCGTPVVGYKCGGPESFLDVEFAKFYDYGDSQSIINYIVSKDYLKIDRKTLSQKASKRFSNETMCDNYLNFFLDIINGEQ